MFLFYGDESGYTGEQFGAQQPVLVVAGILLNTHGASKTRRQPATAAATALRTVSPSCLD